MASAIEKIYPAVIAMKPNSGDTTFNLDVTDIYEELQLQLTGTLTNSGYTTAPVKRVESIENLLRRVSLIGTGKDTGAQTDTFCSVDAAYLQYQTQCMETTAPSRVDVGTANAAYAFSSTFKRYFGLKKFKPFYSAGLLDSRFLSTFTLGLGWRDINAMIQPGTGVGGTSVLSNVGVTVHATLWTGASKKVRTGYVKQSQRQFDLTNMSGIDKDFKDAPVGNWMPRQTFKGMVGDTDYADPTDAIFATTLRAEGAHVKTIQNSNFSWLDSTFAQLKAQQKTQYSLESIRTGYITKEYSRTGNGGDSLNLTATGTTLKNTFDLTTVGGSTNTLVITDEEVIWRG